jgi:hypothetical protein
MEVHGKQRTDGRKSSLIIMITLTVPLVIYFMDSIYSHFYLILCGSISFVTFPIL